MDKASGKLTVYFEEPFWVGVFERIEDGKLSGLSTLFQTNFFRLFFRYCTGV